MLGQIGPTPYDLRFSLFGIPVHVNPTFWLIAVLLGWRAMQRPDPQEGLILLLVWVACLFFSILIHELGHGLTAQHYGWPPEIYLYHFGGLAVFMPHRGYTTRRAILIAFAGPGAGFIVYGLVVAIEQGLIRTGHHEAIGPFGEDAIYILKWINLWWGLVNLLPVLPLDGGQICRELCISWRTHGGMDLALKISIVVAGGVAFLLFTFREQLGIGYYPGILFALLCFFNIQTLQSYRTF